MMKPTYFSAVVDLIGGAINGEVEGPLDTYTFIDGQTPPTEEEVRTRLASMVSEWNAQAYARNRQAEYPTIAELTVALYDTDDKTAIETKRAEVKAKYPKPE